MTWNPSALDCVEKYVDIRQPVARTWGAIADSTQFSSWFGVRFTDPFVAGKVAEGIVTQSGYEGLKSTLRVVAMQAPELFSFGWHPHAIDPTRNYSAEPSTRVEFRPVSTPGGTRVTVTETGFEALAADRAARAHTVNSGGWAMQLLKLAHHLEA